MNELYKIFVLLYPLIKELLQYLSNRELRALKAEQVKAKTPEEKREVARKIANRKFSS
jgi:hypothetical protein